MRKKEVKVEEGKLIEEKFLGRTATQTHTHLAHSPKCPRKEKFHFLQSPSFFFFQSPKTLLFLLHPGQSVRAAILLLPRIINTIIDFLDFSGRGKGVGKLEGRFASSLCADRSTV